MPRLLMVSNVNYLADAHQPHFCHSFCQNCSKSKEMGGIRSPERWLLKLSCIFSAGQNKSAASSWDGFSSSWDGVAKMVLLPPHPLQLSCIPPTVHILPKLPTLPSNAYITYIHCLQLPTLPTLLTLAHIASFAAYIRACHHEAIFSKSLAWVFFCCLFMFRNGLKNLKNLGRCFHEWKMV